MSAHVPRAQQLRLRENQLFLILTIVIGVVAGLAAVLFTVAIEQTSHRLFGLAPSKLRLVVIPPLMSIVTGILLAKVFPDVRGSGVPQTEAAYHLSGGVIPTHVPFGKFLTGVLCIGSGHSMGREGPSVQIGAGLASLIGRWLQLSPQRVRDLVPVGAAGALSAAFNTPVAAVLFALEEIIGDMNAALLGSTVVASVAAVVVERSILGNEPLFHVPTYRLLHPAELLAYAALGIIGGIVSLIFCKGLVARRGVFLRLPTGTKWFQPAIGGLVISAVLLYSPAIMGVGYEYVDQALNGRLLLKTMAILCFLKLGATIVSYASGNAGGIIRAPMTSVFMIFEITQDYQILVPLMVANLLSFMISRHYQPLPVYHALLHQDGVHLPSPATIATGDGTLARHVMRTDMRFIAPDQSVDAALALVAQGTAPAYLVGTPEKLVGVVTQSQLMTLRETGRGADRLDAIAPDEFSHAHPDHPIDVVLERLAESDGILPVVSRTEARRVEGVITGDSILSAGSDLRRRRQSGA